VTRLLVGAVGALIVGFAVWAALPSAPPLAAPATTNFAPATPTATPVPAPTPAPPVARAPSPAAGDELLDLKIAGCIGAQQAVSRARATRGGPAPAGQPSDAAVVSRGCAPLYREAACRDAMMRFDDPPPERRSAAVLEACARAYCGLFTDPKPSVCAHPDAVPQDEQQYAAWDELRKAMLTHDIGAGAAQVVLTPPARPR
jgi:hypothetical protein